MGGACLWHRPLQLRASSRVSRCVRGLSPLVFKGRGPAGWGPELCGTADPQGEDRPHWAASPALTPPLFPSSWGTTGTRDLQLWVASTQDLPC